MFKFIIKTFDQLKKHNFDQVNFGQTTPCRFKCTGKMGKTWEIIHGNQINQNTSKLQEKNFRNLAPTFGVVRQVIFLKQQYHLELQNIVTYDCKTLLSTTVKQLPDGHEPFSSCGDGLKFCWLIVFDAGRVVVQLLHHFLQRLSIDVRRQEVQLDGVVYHARHVALMSNSRKFV